MIDSAFVVVVFSLKTLHVHHTSFISEPFSMFSMRPSPFFISKFSQCIVVFIQMCLMPLSRTSVHTQYAHFEMIFLILFPSHIIPKIFSPQICCTQIIFFMISQTCIISSYTSREKDKSRKIEENLKKSLEKIERQRQQQQ
jgi:hypothetical protein